MAVAGAAAVLVTLGVAYYFTYEPAFEISVTWREGTTWPRRTQLERQFGLVRGRDIADWTVWYDLVDVRPSNILAMETQAEVAAIGGLDLDTDTVPPDAPYGDGWMWIGPQLPVLRHRGVVPGLILVCAVVLVTTLPPALGVAWRIPRVTWPQAVAAAMLITLGGAWYATRERAPGISIRWGDDLTADRQRALERQFRLARRRAPEGRTMTYDLLDIRPSNVRALAGHPDVEDTGYVDRATFNVPANAPFGHGDLWIGTRLPLLRTYGIVPAVVLGCAAVLFYPLTRGAWKRRRPHA